MDRVYVSGSLDSELQLKQLRNYLWVSIDAHEHYKRLHPHITIIPGFNVREENTDKVRKIIRQTRFKGEEIRMKRLSVYENIHKPYVVQINIEYDIDEKINNLISRLKPLAKTDMREPVTPHITLFKTQGWWDELPQEKKEILQEEVRSTVGLRDTEISGVNIEVR
jgi:2'-5' RNA ligase